MSPHRKRGAPYEETRSVLPLVLSMLIIAGVIFWALSCDPPARTPNIHVPSTTTQEAPQ